MNDQELTEHFRNLFPQQQLAKRHQLLKDAMMFRAVYKATKRPAYNALADECFRQHHILSRVMREAVTE